VLDARADTLDAEEVQRIYGTSAERAPVQAVEPGGSAPEPDAARSAAA
jgi:hypothetical protein